MPVDTCLLNAYGRIHDHQKWLSNGRVAEPSAERCFTFCGKKWTFAGLACLVNDSMQSGMVNLSSQNPQQFLRLTFLVRISITFIH